MKDIYVDGTYLENNPTWDEEHSPWKAKQVFKIINKNSLTLKSCCEVGCGAGEILNQLSNMLDKNISFVGYDISPQAIELCKQKANANLEFRLADLTKEESEFFDLVMAIDVFEHVDDVYGFLRKLRLKGEYKIFHIPLDLSAQAILRVSPIIKERRTVGHIHYYTKELALETLKDTGYEIIDYFYTGGALELPKRGWKANIMKLPRKLAFAINEDLAVRILGGYSLLVLAK